MKKILFGLAFVAVLGASRPASADLLVNGSFETGNFNGWNVNAGATGVVASGGAGGFTAEDGNFYAAMGAVGSLGTIAQTFNTTAGQAYELTYYLASNGTTPNEFRTDINGNTYFDQVNIPTQDWTLYTYDFVASGATSTVTFYERNDPNYLGLDNVQVNLARSVPEPSAIALFGVGAIGFVAAMRKRRNPAA